MVSDFEIKRQVLDFMVRLGVGPAGSCDLVLDGGIHRYRVDGDKNGTKAGYYCIYPDKWPAGYIGSWRHGGDPVKWRFDVVGLDSATQDHLRKWERSAECKRLRARREEERAAEQLAAANKAYERFQFAPAASADHPYFLAKEVKGYGLRQDGDDLLVPLYNGDDVFQSMQRIGPDSKKRFEPGCQVRGAFFTIGEDVKQGPVLICEGYATGATLHELTGNTVICAMNCYNLIEVAPKVKKLYPDRKILVAADNDSATEGNPGLTCSKKAAKFGLDGVIFPEFPAGVSGTDFNDLARVLGAGEAEERICLLIERELSGDTEFQAAVDGLGWCFDHRAIVEQPRFAAGLFPIGQLSIIASPPGIGKSWLVQRLATDLSRGGDVLDGLAAEISPMKVLFFAGEAGLKQMVLRGAAAGWEPSEENFVIVDAISAALKGVNLMLDDPMGQMNVQRLIEKNTPRVVFFDSLLSFHCADESDFKSMNPVLIWLLRLAKDRNLAVVVVHHQRKPKGSEQRAVTSQNDIIGSSVFSRLAAFCLKLEAVCARTGELLGASPEGSEADIAAKVSCVKSWHRKPRPFTFQIIDGRMFVSLDVKFTPAHDADLLAVLQENFDYEERFSSSEAAKRLRQSPTNFSKKLKSFIDGGILGTEGSGKATTYWLIRNYGEALKKVLQEP